MHGNWQDPLALLVVAAAAGYLLRACRAAFLRKSGSACSGCPKCPSTPTGGSPVNLVDVDKLLRSGPKR